MLLEPWYSASQSSVPFLSPFNSGKLSWGALYFGHFLPWMCDVPIGAQFGRRSSIFLNFLWWRLPWWSRWHSKGAYFGNSSTRSWQGEVYESTLHNSWENWVAEKERWGHGPHRHAEEVKELVCVQHQPMSLPPPSVGVHPSGENTRGRK